MTIRHGPPWPMMIIVAVLVVSACTSDDAPTRPPITRPLDATVFADRVCDLLPLDVAVRLGYRGTGSADKSTQPSSASYFSCHRFPPSSPTLTFYLYPSTDQLAHQYEASRNTRIGDTNEPWLEPLTIAGQPAVTLGRSHQKPNRTCDVVVGLMDNQSLRVHAGQHYRDGTGTSAGPDDGDGRACEHAMAVADAIVRNLGG